MRECGLKEPTARPGMKLLNQKVHVGMTCAEPQATFEGIVKGQMEMRKKKKREDNVLEPTYLEVNARVLDAFVLESSCRLREPVKHTLTGQELLGTPHTKADELFGTPGRRDGGECRVKSGTAEEEAMRPRYSSFGRQRVGQLATGGAN